ncbi:hypothetical protein PSP6_160102 [Paraburkholderia tropica]|uniref:hypothetical protein n=1 Tax=Paraburkholderia tropica TaxID=92647 RepID=UPI001CAC0E78|nr:hypothetical protein [Paraburkholderia tropica]CAG9195771.1 hypothetical protein PSP6_160102 [Paraburkholderia tropica]
MTTTHINDKRLTPATIEARITSAAAFADAHSRADDANDRAQLFIAAVTGFFTANVARSRASRPGAA